MCCRLGRAVRDRAGLGAASYTRVILVRRGGRRGIFTRVVMVGALTTIARGRLVHTISDGPASQFQEFAFTIRH